MNVGLLTEMMNVGGAATLVLRQALWLAAHRHTPVVFSCGGPLVEELRDAGIEHVEIASFDPSAPFTPEQLVSDGAALADAIDNFGLQAMVAQAQWTFSFACAAAHRAIPVYLHIISPVYWPPKTAQTMEYLQDAVSHGRVLSMAVASSLAFAQHFGLSADLPTLNVPIEPLPAATRTRDEVRADLNVAPNAKLVLCVARIDRDRAPMIPHLAQAVMSLRVEYPELRLVVVGDGTEMQAVQAAVGDAATFTGYRRDLPDLYRAADLFVSEGSVVQEAARAGVPCIATNSTVYPALAGMAFSIFGMHIVDHFFVMPNNVVSPVPLADALRLLLSDGDRAREIGHAGEQCVQTYWNVDTIMQWQLAAFAGQPQPLVHPGKSIAILEIDGGQSDDVDYAAQLLQSVRSPERFGIRTNEPVPWERFFAMPLEHAQGLCRAAWRSTLTIEPVYRLRERAVDGPPGSLLEELRETCASMPLPPVDRREISAMQFGGKQFAFVAVLPGSLDRAMQYACAVPANRAVVLWEPDAPGGDRAALDQWRAMFDSPTDRARFFSVQGQIPWAAMGGMLFHAATYADGGGDRLQERRALAAQLGLAVERY